MDADRHGAVKRLGISNEVYEELLSAFVAQAREKSALLAAVADAQDWGKARKIAHFVKGIAGNLGVLTVQEAAGEVEGSVLAGAAPGRIRDAIDKLIGCIAGL
jgi:two-component system, sensor histidine kinase and response regulator